MVTVTDDEHRQGTLMLNNAYIVASSGPLLPRLSRDRHTTHRAIRLVSLQGFRI